MAFTMAYDKRNRENLDKLAVNTKKVAYQWYNFCIDNEIDILIHETIRTEEQQRANVASGSSQTMKSYHLVGQALDFVPAYINKEGKPDVNWNGYGAANIKKAIAKAKALGFEWGGDWQKFVDKPHLQYNHKGYGTDQFTTTSSTTVTTESTQAVTSGATEKSGADSTIKAFQTWLNKNCSAGLTVDGVYGPKTKTAATKAYQKILGVTQDGIFGAKSKAAVKTLKSGSKGNDVYLLQAMLYCAGYSCKGVDGIFGANTTSAVKSYQKSKGLTQDGIAGKNTMEKLYK